MRNDHSNVQLNVTSVYVLNDYKKVLVESAPHPIKKVFRTRVYQVSEKRPNATILRSSNYDLSEPTGDLVCCTDTSIGVPRTSTTERRESN